jgi:branched-subunit amino acid transport protein
MSAETATLWLLFAGMGLITFLLRSSCLLLPESVAIPPLLRRSLRFVPAAVLTAIWTPELFLQQGALHLALDNTRLLAGTAAVAAAWRWRQTYATIFTGLIALHLFDWLLRELRLQQWL